MAQEAAQNNDQQRPEKTGIIETFNQLPANVQRLIIGVIFLTFLVGLVYVKNLIDVKMAKETEPAVD